MTNYELFMQNMTPEILANIHTQLVCVNNESLFYMTSTGQLFPTDKHADAVKFEYDWLTSAVPEQESTPQVEKEGEPDAPEKRK